jgi:hypothetical protein
VIGESTGRDCPIDRTTAANGVGLSERHRKTALRVANVLAEQFEAAVGELQSAYRDLLLFS